MSGLNVAIMGATGAVGQEMLKTLEARNFPVATLKLLASERSAGKKILYRGRMHEVEVLDRNSFAGVDLVLSSAGGSISKEYVPAAVEAGAVVVDNTSAYRMDENVPLVVPEVNADALDNHNGIIANPNCSTAQMLVALAPIHRAAGLRRLVISTYQSVSGTGQNAIDECLEQTRAILAGQAPVSQVYPHQIAFNVLPHIDVFEDNGYTKEELKMVNETHKILGSPEIAITATAVRVPVMRGHSEAINVEMVNPVSVEEIRELLSNAPGVVVIDNVAKNEYPMPIYAEGRYETYVGRIRKDISNDKAIDMWVVSDNLLKGAALNSVQIAEELLRRDLVKATVTA